MQKFHGDDGWRALVRAFYRDHDCHTPLFTELAREFLRYLDERAAGEAGHDDPPWLRELAHYEWVELALQISEASCDDVAHDPDGDLLAGAPLVSPLAWPLAYAWPVHRIGPDFQPETPPDTPTLLMLRREADGTVSFLDFGSVKEMPAEMHLRWKEVAQLLVTGRHDEWRRKSAALFGMEHMDPVVRRMHQDYMLSTVTMIAADEEAFAAAIVRVLGDVALRARLGDAGRALVADRYSIAAVATAFDRVHADLLQGGGR